MSSSQQPIGVHNNSTIHHPTPEAHFDSLFRQMYTLCQQQGWGDPFSYARSREIHMANFLGHTIAKNYSGSDACDPDGNLVEYKTTIAKSINATYNGISVQETWEEQVAFLLHHKIAKYTWHYFARYQDGQIQEIWKMSGAKVLELLLPKIEKQFHSQKSKKDPRLGASLSAKEIQANAIKI
jgi:hypothetical protein